MSLAGQKYIETVAELADFIKYPGAWNGLKNNNTNSPNVLILKYIRA